MTIAIYDYDPVSLFGFQASTGTSAPSVLFPGSRQDGDDVGGNLQSFLFFGFFPIRRATFMRFDFGRFIVAPPPGSVITNAFLRLTASGVHTEALNATIYLVAKDGVWDPIGSVLDSFGQGSTNGNDAQVAVRDTTAGTLVPQTYAGTTGFSAWPLQTQLVDDMNAIGQTVLTTAANPLGACDFRLRRQVAKAGNMFVDVYLANPDGTPDEVTGIIAVSDTITHNSLSTAAQGSIKTFTFSGVNQIAIANATRYVFVVRSTTTGSGPLQAPQVLYKAGNLYASGAMQFGDGFPGAPIREGFSESSYPEMGQFPHLYEVDDSTIRVPAHGPTLSLAFPTFPISGATVDVGGLAPMVQAWVNDGGYVTNGVIAVGIQARAPTDATNRNRTWTNAQLHIEYATPVAASASASVVWGVVTATAAAITAITALAVTASVSIVWGTTAAAIVIAFASATAAIVWGVPSALTTLVNSIVAGIRSVVSAASRVFSRISARTVVQASASGRVVVRSKTSDDPVVSSDASAKPKTSGSVDVVK